MILFAALSRFCPIAAIASWACVLARADRFHVDAIRSKVHTTPANKGESPEFATMIDGAKAQRVLADKATARVNSFKTESF